MGDDTNKRLLLAFGLAFAILILWRAFLLPPPPKAPPAKPATGQTASGSSTPSAPSNPAGPAGGASGAPAVSGETESAARAGARPGKSVAPAPLPVEQGTKAQDIVIDADLYRVTLSTQGGVVKSWILKKYTDATGQPLDVVDQAACVQLGFPMSIGLADKALAAKLNSALYVPQAFKLVVGNAQKGAPLSGSTLTAPVNITFTYSDGKDQVRKVFSFENGYQSHVEVSVFDGQNNLPVDVAWPGGFGDSSLPPTIAALTSQAFYRTADSSKVHTEKLSASWIGRIFSSSSAQQDLNVGGPLTYAGLEDAYFAAVFLPDSPEAGIHVTRQPWTPPDWKGQDKDKPSPLRAVLGTPASKPLGFRLVVVPKDVDVLRAMNPPLDDVVDFGWFSIIAKPLFLAMRYIYDHVVHNWGWAIVILTVVLNIALFPLKLKSIHAAQRMQKVAPIIKSIQAKYKQYKFNDPRKQKMNQEMMKVYSDHGINPLGGCLPTVAQFPLIYAIYEVLETAIDLRHAPWIGCVKDLAAPDSCHLFGIPLALLPTIMIITMFVMQKMTPMATVDPAQQRMMFLMPLIFGIIFYRLQSGLVLYYLTVNVVGIGQQLIINHFIPVAHVVPPGGQTPPDPAGTQRPGRARKAVSVKE